MRSAVPRHLQHGGTPRGTRMTWSWQSDEGGTRKEQGSTLVLPRSRLFYSVPQVCARSLGANLGSSALLARIARLHFRLRSLAIERQSVLLTAEPNLVELSGSIGALEYHCRITACLLVEVDQLCRCGRKHLAALHDVKLHIRSAAFPFQLVFTCGYLLSIHLHRVEYLQRAFVCFARSERAGGQHQGDSQTDQLGIQ